MGPSGRSQASTIVLVSCPCGRTNELRLTVEASGPTSVDHRDSRATAIDLPSVVLNVLRLAGLGLTDKEIARTLNLSLDREKRVMRDALIRLSARNRTEAVLRAREEGLLQVSSE